MEGEGGGEGGGEGEGEGGREGGRVGGEGEGEGEGEGGGHGNKQNMPHLLTSTTGACVCFSPHSPHQPESLAEKPVHAVEVPEPRYGSTAHSV